MKQCKCEHWQECPVCQPRRFDADGNRLPPEPTPLQAARAKIEKDEALLRQVQRLLDFYGACYGVAKSDMPTITALRERLGENK